MRKNLLFLCMIILVISTGYAQRNVIFSEDFENPYYEDFTIDHFGEWLNIDLDKQETTPIAGVRFEVNH